VRDRLADHWAEMLGLRVMQVNEAEEVGCLPKRQLAGGNSGTGQEVYL
jgi:hypothetical protein